MDGTDVPAHSHSVLKEHLQGIDQQKEIELYYELLSSGHSVGEILELYWPPQVQIRARQCNDSGTSFIKGGQGGSRREVRNRIDGRGAGKYTVHPWLDRTC